MKPGALFKRAGPANQAHVNSPSKWSRSHDAERFANGCIPFCRVIKSYPVNFKLDLNDKLVAIFKAKLTLEQTLKFSPLLLYSSARLTPFVRECTES